VAGFPPKIVKPRKRAETKGIRIRMTRSILLDGQHVAKDSIQEVARPIADGLIATGSAVPLRSAFWIIAAIVALGVAAALWLCRAGLWW
jgi:hypothetical protein